MKKSWILWALIVILAVGGSIGMTARVNAARDQVEIRERAVFGDRQAAAGLALTVRNTYDHRLFWDTACVLEDEDLMAETSFRFSAWRELEAAPQPEEGVQIESYYLYGFEPDYEGPQPGLARAYQELYDSLEPGEEGTRVVNVRDYLEYYPLLVELSAPGTDRIYLDSADAASLSLSETELDQGTSLYAAYYLQNYFKIPILENEQVELTVGKPAGTARRGVSGGSMTRTSPIGMERVEDAYDFYTCSAMTDSMCFFTFNTHSNDGLIDTGQIPGGYGIYGLPYFQKGDTEGGYDIEGFGNYYPLDPAIMVIDLSVSPQGAELLLHAVEEGEYVITVIDLDTMEMRQKLSVCDWPEDGYGWYLYEGADFLAMSLCMDRLAVVSEGADGLYQVDILADVDNDQEDDHPIYLIGEEAVTFDGRRLAVIRTIGGGYCTDFFVAVYDASGLLYYGEYDNSLSAEIDMASAYADEWYVHYTSSMPGCEAVYDEPITAEWR